MARTPDVPGKPARRVLQVRLTDDDWGALDVVRGEVSRSDWARDLIRRELAALIGDEPLPEPPPTIDAPETEAEVEPEGTVVIPPRKDLDTPHLHRTTEVARRTVRGKTVKTVKCLICQEAWER